jgi:hypothetical protein
VQRPSDEDIANLQLRYRDSKNPKRTNSRPANHFNAKGFLKRTIKPVSSKNRLTRELRALDRRRLLEGGILPPPERQTQLAVIKGGPRTGNRIKLNKIDSYRSDSDEEPEAGEDLFADKYQCDRDNSSDEEQEKPEKDELIYGIDIKEDVVDDDGTTSLPQQAAKRQRTSCATSEPK